MWRDDPVNEPWYELDFQMKRWLCPVGLPTLLLEDIIEAIRVMDRVLFDAMKLVDRHTYGWEAMKKRYIRHSVYEIFRVEFERAEDGLLVARHDLAARWSAIQVEHQRQISKLPANLYRFMRNPEADYAMSYTITEMPLDEHLRQFLEGVQACKEQVFLVP